MLKKLIGSLFYLLCASFLFADSGFYSIDSESIPSSVRETAKNVLNIHAKSGTYTFETAEELDRAFREAQGSTSLASLVKTAVISQCYGKAQIVPCEIPLLSSGSAVLVELEDGIGGRAMATVGHNFRNYFRSVSQGKRSFEEFFEALKATSLSFLLVDAPSPESLSFVYSSSPKDGYAKADILTAGYHKFPIPGFSDAVKSETDFSLIELKNDIKVNKGASPVSFEIPRAVSKDVQLDVNGREDIYLVGFPVATTGRAEGKNSNGRQLYISKGRVLRHGSTFQTLEKDSRTGEQVKVLRESEKFFEVSADSCKQMSGGAAVDSRGFVVGIVIGGALEPSSTRLSYGMVDHPCVQRPEAYTTVLKIEHIFDSLKNIN